VLKKIVSNLLKDHAVLVARTVTNRTKELIKQKMQRENHLLPGATASTSAPTALPSFQSDVKFVMGRSGTLLWIQCSNLNKDMITFISFTSHHFTKSHIFLCLLSDNITVTMMVILSPTCHSVSCPSSTNLSFFHFL
jgi:hypothetical protein